jgi:predicted alpha/beta-hydrolase family hydrolase
LVRPGLQLEWLGALVIRSEDPYAACKQEASKPKPPDREPVLRETWLRVIEQLGREGLVIGGKSMGGRWEAMRSGLTSPAGNALA